MHHWLSLMIMALFLVTLVTCGGNSNGSGGNGNYCSVGAQVII